MNWKIWTWRVWHRNKTDECYEESPSSQFNSLDHKCNALIAAAESYARAVVTKARTPPSDIISLWKALFNGKTEH